MVERKAGFMPDAKITPEKIEAMRSKEVSLPEYSIAGIDMPAATVRLGDKADHLMNMALYAQEAGALVAPFDSAPLRELNMAFVEPYNALDTWFRDIISNRTKELPSRQTARKVLAEAYNAFSGEHSYGRYVHTYIQNMADELELGNLRDQRTAKPRSNLPAQR